MNQSAAASAAAPTGCYKCGRPGHWSRDCPSDANASETNNNETHNFQSDSNIDPNTRSKPPLALQKPKQKPPRRTRPKLTPDMLLSDAGVGHILRYFPRALKCRGRGHEVDDLGHLLGLYADWHKQLIPYYSFEQFINKVERLGSTKRVKLCLRQLRDKVADGENPTKVQEPQTQQDPADEQDAPNGLDMPSTSQKNNMQTGDENILEEIAQSVWEEATEEPPQPEHVEDVAVDTNRTEEQLNQTVETNPNNSNKSIMSEEQLARMEANRLRALEKAAARSCSSRA